MAYRIWIFMLCLAFVACGNDGNKKIDAPGSGSDSASGGDGGGTDSPSTGDAAVGAVCGSTTCMATEECCTGGGSGDTCVPLTTCGTVAFACDGPEDCPGQVCCYGGTGSGSAGTGGSECKNANQCQTSACHVDTDCTQAGAMKCCQIGQTAYNLCLAQCP